MDDTQNDTSRHDAPQRDDPHQAAEVSDANHFTLTVDQVAAKFEDEGLPRSSRTIQRYCQKGHLSCSRVDTEIAEMYYIDPNSVDRRIKELKQLEMVTRAPGVSRHDAPSRDTSRHVATERDVSQKAVTSDEIEKYEQRIKELENENKHLEIDKRVKEQLANMLQEDREKLFTQMTDYVQKINDQARVIGQLETKLELGPGNVVSEQDRPTHHEPARDAGSDHEINTRPEATEATYTRLKVTADPVEYPPRYEASRAPYDERGGGDNPARPTSTPV